MKKSIHFLVIALLICIILPLSSVCVSAETDEILLEGSCGDNTSYVLYESGELVISGEGEMKDYTSTNEDWHQYTFRIKEVKIENGVTSIGDRAFFVCSNLKSIHVADSVTSIGDYAFLMCEGLTSIEIPDNVISIGDAAFNGCSNLKTVSLGNGVTSIGYSAFSNCSDLTSIHIPDSVTSIDNRAFSECTSLTSISIPDGVTEIGVSTFESCSSLTTVKLGKGITSISNNAFSECTSLTSISMQNGVTSIGKSAFGDCSSLETIDIPDSVTSIGTFAFSRCYELTSIDIPDGVTTIAGNTFNECSGLISATIPDGVTLIDEYAFVACSSLRSIVIPDSVTSIGSFAFERCRNLSTIKFLGDFPNVGTLPFNRVSAAVYYPADNSTYNEAKNGYYGGALIWVESDPIPTPTPTPTPDTSDEVVRLKGADRFATSRVVADTLKEELGVEKFDVVILVDGRDFADALAGSYLAAKKSAPILMVDKKNQDNFSEVKKYIADNMNSNGTVYILGGEVAVPTWVETELTGYNVKRLKGQNRYGTNLAILNEVGVTNEPILVCNAKNFADSLSASATGLPLLLVGSNLNAQQKEFLAAHTGNNIYVLGGTGAVSENVEEALKAYGTVERVKGTTRYETSIEIAKKFFPNADEVVMAFAKNFPDGLCGGPLAYAMKAPLILTATGNNKAAEYTTSKQITSGAVIGGATLIDDDAVKNALGKLPIIKK